VCKGDFSALLESIKLSGFRRNQDDDWEQKQGNYWMVFNQGSMQADQFFKGQPRGGNNENENRYG
jgi:hypothetical protein